MRVAHVPEVDQVIDSLPVMLARGGHAYTSSVARARADVGYCASKKQYFHGVRLHALAQGRSGQLPSPQQIWLREGSCADVRSLLALLQWQSSRGNRLREPVAQRRAHQPTS